MGRAMLIMVTGLLVALGYTFMGMASQKSSMTIRNVQSANEAMARNIAHGGIQYAIHELSSSWSPGESNKKIRDLDGGTVAFYWEEHPEPKKLTITSVATLNDVTDEVIATVLLGDIVDISEVPGAMGVYGENTEVTIKGNPPKIDGKNYDMDAVDPNDEGHKPGVAGVNDEGNTFNLSGNSNDNGDYIEGEPRYDHDPELSGDAWNDAIEKTYLPNAEEYNGDLGSKSSPKIVAVENSGRADGNGAGILIIKKDASFTISGNTRYYGLIIVQGELELKGTPQIYGSVIFADDSNVSIDPEGAIKGTPDIRYSSDALNNVNENLQLNSGGAEIVSMYD